MQNKPSSSSIRSSRWPIVRMYWGRANGKMYISGSKLIPCNDGWKDQEMTNEEEEKEDAIRGCFLRGKIESA